MSVYKSNYLYTGYHVRFMKASECIPERPGTITATLSMLSCKISKYVRKKKTRKEADGCNYTLERPFKMLTCSRAKKPDEIHINFLTYFDKLHESKVRSEMNFKVVLKIHWKKFIFLLIFNLTGVILLNLHTYNISYYRYTYSGA